MVGVMRSNVEKVLDRDVKLSDLDRRADDLNAASVTFATSSRKLKKKMWWENLKWQLVLGGVVIAVIIIVVTVLVVEFGGDDSPDVVVDGSELSVNAD